MALLSQPLLFPNSPGTGLLNRARSWWNSDADRQERLRAMFAGWAMGQTPQQSLGYGAQGMLGARGEARERKQQEDAARAFMGLLGGDAVTPGAFPTLDDVSRQRPGGMLGGGLAAPPAPAGILNQPSQGSAGWQPDMDPDVTGAAPVAPPAPALPPPSGNLPRGLRNNNPGNIEDGAFARSMPGYQGSDGRFARFASLEDGSNAMSALLGSYVRRGFDTPTEIINRWAPPGENDSSAYVARVAQLAGLDPRAPVPPDAIPRLAEAMAYVENGRPVDLPLGGSGAPAAAPTQTAQSGYLFQETPRDASGQPAYPQPAQPSGAGVSPRLGQLFQILAMPGLNEGQRAAVGMMIQQEMQQGQGTDPTDDIREYQYATQQGYQGSFQEWITEGRRAGATVINNNVGPTGIDYGDPGKGLVWQRDQEGNITLDERGAPVAIPFQGGEAWQEQEAAAAQEEARDTTVARATDIVTQDIDRALGIISQNPGLTTGIGGALTGWVPGSPTFNLNSLIDTVRANVGFDKLQAMRDASPTGGALGQVSQQENLLLQATIGNLANTQDRQQLVDNLNRVYNVYLDIVHGPGAGPPRRPLSFQEPPPVELPSGRMFAPPNPSMLGGADTPSQGFTPPPAPASSAPTHIWTPEGGLRPVQ